MSRNTCDLQMVRQTAGLLFQPGSTLEIRIPRPFGRKRVVAGFFDDIEKLVEDVAKWSGKAEAVYATLNPINRALLSVASNRLQEYATGLTTDDPKDVVGRRWLLIDVDACRPKSAYISSTEQEHQAALQRAALIDEELSALGWPEPVYADSGNGAHLLYLINLPNDEASRSLLERCLKALDLLYSDEAAAIDTSVFNAARITKLYGTLVCKGDSTEERPHRMACLLDVPQKLETVPVERLERLAAQLPQEPPKFRKPASASAPFDAESWLREHGLPVVASGPWNGGSKWVLSPCPWNTAHTDRSAYVVQFANGAIAAGCHHNGCDGKDWYALRDLYEPDWRTKRTHTAEARNGKRPGAAPSEAPDFRVLRMTDVQRERVEWLWLNRIPFGKLTILDGDPGLGKSTITIDLAARLTTGRPMPGCELVTSAPASVLLLTVEDGLGDTLRPRLEAAGADLDRIHAYDNTAALPTLPDHIAEIEGKILESGAKLVIMDPLMAFLSGEVRSHVDQEVRRALAPLAGVAQSTGAAILFVRHLNKLIGGPAMYRGGGSIGIIGAARSALLVGRSPDQPDVCVLVSVKTNLGKPPPALAYKIVDGGDGSSRIEWQGVCEVTADQLVTRPSRNASAAAGAAEFLEECLADGPMAVREVLQRARAAGVALRTLERAKRDLNIKSGRMGTMWAWRLPDATDDPDEDPNTAHSEDLAALTGLFTDVPISQNGAEAVKTANTANSDELAVLKEKEPLREAERAPAVGDTADVGGLDAEDNEAAYEEIL